MDDAILSVRGLSRSFGALRATDNVDLDLRAGECHAVIGPNGAGKTTLLSLISGEVTPSSGKIDFLGAEVTKLRTHQRARRGIARTFQITNLLPEFTAEENVVLAVLGGERHAYRFFRAAMDDAARRAVAHGALARVGLAERGDMTVREMSHGEHRLLEVAVALAMRPKALLLDEPMAGLGPTEAPAFINLLRSLKSEAPILLVEHDMDAVFALADRVTVLTYGRVLLSGTPSEIRGDARVRSAYLGEDDA